MYTNTISNSGTILGFKEKGAWKAKDKKSLKSLLICLRPYNFKAHFRILIRKLSYFCTPKNSLVDNKKSNSEKLQMEDILIPNAALDAFVIEMDVPTTKYFEEIEKKQNEVLKLKEVNEERLRMVVQL